MTKKKLSIDKATFEIERSLKKHIGSNGKSHLPADADNDGYMPSDLFKKSVELFRETPYLYGKDILALEPGCYVGSHFKNHPIGGETPTTWISYVDIKNKGEGRKEITVADSISGNLWRRTIHTGGDVTTGTGTWARYYGLVLLWDGSSKLDAAVNLANSLYDDNNSTKYPTIAVRYQTDAGNNGIAFGNPSGVIIDTVNANNDDTVLTADIFEAEVIFPTHTTAKMKYNTHTNFYTMESTGNAAYMQSQTAAINIKKIWGLV